MCVVLAKYFNKIGWVGIKNRDRNYIPEISFNLIQSDKNTQRMMFHDDITGYEEGINNHGVSILNASLMVEDDEREIARGNVNNSPDGEKNRVALKEKTAKLCVEKLIELQLTGNTLVFDTTQCFLLEASIKDGVYVHICREVSPYQTVARTNHGIYLPWAGYQRDSDSRWMTLSRISSESRLKIATELLQVTNTPMQLMNSMAKVYVDDPQLNIMRTSTEKKKMRTTAQEMMIPSEHTLYVRPICSHITFDFWSVNRPKPDVWVELLSNRPLYDDDTTLPFAKYRLTHTV